MIRRTFFILLMLICNFAWANEVVVSVDRNPILLDQTFKITVSASGDVEGEPDLTILTNDFTLFGSPSTTNRIQYINGKVSSEKSWSIMAAAKEAGEIEIPSISVGKDKSKPFTVKVVEQNDSVSGKSEIFIETELSSDTVFVQERAIYTVRLFLSIATGNASLTEPKVTGGDTLIEKLGEDNRFRTRINGKRYEVVERQYMITPQTSGEMEFSPITFKGVLSLSTRFLADPFDYQPRTILKRSETELLTVKPIPDGFNGQVWLPSDELILEESWSEEPPVFQVGEPITRTVTIKGLGLSSSQLPELNLDLPDGVKSYPDQAILNDELSNGQLIGVRTEKLALIPLEIGEMILPEISIDYWLKSENRIAKALIPERHIQVIAGESVSNGKSVNGSNLSSAIDGSKSTQLESGVQSEVTPNSVGTSPWLWVSLFLAIGWLSTLFYFWKIRQTQSRKGKQAGNPNVKKVLLKIEQACEDNDAIACKEALMSWGKIRFDNNAPSNLQDISRCLGGDMDDALEDLSQTLYSKEKGKWSGHTFWLRFDAIIKLMDEKNNVKEDVRLEPLFKLS